jgi:hypothetical protein
VGLRRESIGKRPQRGNSTSAPKARTLLPGTVSWTRTKDPVAHDHRMHPGKLCVKMDRGRSRQTSSTCSAPVHSTRRQFVLFAIWFPSADGQESTRPDLRIATVKAPSGGLCPSVAPIDPSAAPAATAPDPRARHMTACDAVRLWEVMEPRAPHSSLSPTTSGQQQLGKRCAVFQTLPRLYHSLERRPQRVTLSYLSNQRTPGPIGVRTRRRFTWALPRTRRPTPVS